MIPCFASQFKISVVPKSLPRGINIFWFFRDSEFRDPQLKLKEELEFDLSAVGELPNVS